VNNDVLQEELGARPHVAAPSLMPLVALLAAAAIGMGYLLTRRDD